ncbi:hypothetical protein ACTA71_000893 [Dictyostelium dimigraforme]
MTKSVITTSIIETPVDFLFCSFWIIDFCRSTVGNQPTLSNTNTTTLAYTPFNQQRPIFQTDQCKSSRSISKNFDFSKVKETFHLPSSEKRQHSKVIEMAHYLQVLIPTFRSLI